MDRFFIILYKMIVQNRTGMKLIYLHISYEILMKIKVSKDNPSGELNMDLDLKIKSLSHSGSDLMSRY